ncbi:hypothetical protein HYH03_018541 [Edaphochlamys debaryana]|uniref:Calcineurin-like phosphoesterase domain-containing protein n=1 Tax=Edaphochlamys debaryana TaxID=47281 RepID=A0A835XLQ3_9CHLO|nr:hypothetical protein HYH03_018541 [Edaphochlamys debaryana]|eukprot:KAG2482524.1 hypothetical protein HYH03_018541 [Edaphochlamys debaryana]
MWPKDSVALLLALALSWASGASGAGMNGRTVALLLQLTDVHLSAMPPPYGDPRRGPDLHALASDLLSRWPLAAAFISGDLTEAKDVYGRGRQYEQEWQEYEGVWKALSSAGGVPPGQVYDMRGNHDTFNSGARCGPADFFCRYSARAAASAGAGPRGRVWVDPVWAPGAAAGGGNGSTRVSGGGGSPGGGSCPVAVLVAVDASLDPGLRGPANFMGALQPHVLSDLHRELTASAAALEAADCDPPPPTIAYGHYPLSTIGYPLFPTPPPPSSAPSSAPDPAPGSTLPAVLAAHGSGAYLSGHLHGAFGRRLHRLHAGPRGQGQQGQEAGPSGARAGPAGPGPEGWLLELESVDWKYRRVLRLLTLDYPSAASDATGGAVGGAAAGGAALAFADLVYVPPAPTTANSTSTTSTSGVKNGVDGGSSSNSSGGGPAEASSLASLAEPSRAPRAHLPLITCPPDARYSPQLWPGRGRGRGSGGSAAAGTGCAAAPEGSGAGAGEGGEGAGEVRPTAVVRALVLPVAPGAAAVPEGVVLRWWCQGAGLGAGAQGRWQRKDGGQAEGGEASRPAATVSLEGEAQMVLESTSGSHSTYVADLLSPAADGARDPGDCPSGLLTAQVVVPGPPGEPPSTSEARPLHWSQPPPPSAPYPSTITTASSSSTMSSATSTPSTSAPTPADAASGDAFWGPRAAAQGPAPLGTSWVEWGVLAGRWYPLGLAAFAAQWLVGAVGLLLLAPRWALQRAQRRRGAGGATGARAGERRSGRGTGREVALGGYTRAATAEGAGAGGAGAEAGSPRRNGSPGDSSGSDGEEAGRQGDRGCSTSVCVGAAGAARAGGGGGGAAGGGGSGGGVIKRSSSGSSSSAGCCGVGTRAPHDGWSAASTSALLPRRAPGGYADPASAAAATSSAAGPPPLPRLALPLRLWPVRDCVVLAAHPVPWAAALAYCLLLAAGPWFVGQLVTPEAARPGPGSGPGSLPFLAGWAVVTPWAVLMRPPDAGGGDGDAGDAAGGGSWVQVAPSLDYVVMCNFTAAFLLLPALLLCASVASRWRGLAAAGRLGPGRRAGAWVGACGGGGGGAALLTWRQAGALGWVAFAWSMLSWKVGAGLGWPAVLVSPGIGWVVPGVAAWMWLAWSHVVGPA